MYIVDKIVTNDSNNYIVHSTNDTKVTILRKAQKITTLSTT